MSQDIEAVIFDVDGTLVDSVDLHARAWQEAFAQFGYDVAFDDVRAQIGKGGDQLIPVFVSASDLDRVGSRIDKYRAEVFAVEYLQKVEAFAQVRELVAALQGDGKHIALASSAKGDELEHYKRVASIEDLIQAETSSDDAERSKPYPDIFRAALHKLRQPPLARCAIVGDSPYDAEAARRAGIRSVGMRCGGFPEDVLRAAGFVRLYDDPAHLLQAYRRLGDEAFSATNTPTPGCVQLAGR
jgi:HAD superfamily hydrolase (TIGR01509 family)